MHCWQTHTSCKNSLLALIAAVSLITLSACSTTNVPEQGTLNDKTSPTIGTSEVSAADSNVIATGAFEGKSDHETSGGGSIVESDGKYFILLAEDFSLDGAPDPKVGLGNNGYDPTTKVGPLTTLKGLSSYEIPQGIEIADYNEIYIWCEKFDVPLGVAKLSFL